MLKIKHLQHPVATLRAAVHHYHERFYDWKLGIRTTGFQPLTKLELTNRDKLAETDSYYPTMPRVISRVFRELILPFPNYSFVDFGCGKGRVLVTAVGYPFKSVIGIDFAKEFCEASRENLDKAHVIRRCKDVQVLYMDAREFRIPADPCVLYFYNPFPEAVMSVVLKNIRESLLLVPRHIRIVLVNPIRHRMMMALPNIRVIQEKHEYVTYDLNAQ